MAVRREIKFRAYRKDDNTMLNWNDLCVWESQYGVTIIDLLNDDNFIVLQYTGLYDRHGDKAAHKDIVEYQGTNYLIEWWEEDTGFYLADLNHLDDLESEYHLKGRCIRESEILGNIYEHPHLLPEEVWPK